MKVFLFFPLLLAAFLSPILIHAGFTQISKNPRLGQNQKIPKAVPQKRLINQDSAVRKLVFPYDSASGSAVWLYAGEDLLAELNGQGETTKIFTQGQGTDEHLSFWWDKNGDQKDKDPDGTDQNEHFYFISDHLGSTIALTDKDNVVVQKYEYNSYGLVTKILDKDGNVITPQSSNYIPNPYTYTGREWEPEIELMYYRARWFSPEMKRFLSEDPIWQTNLYSYVGNNPVNLVDPFGQYGSEVMDWVEAAEKSNTWYGKFMNSTMGVLAAFKPDVLGFGVEFQSSAGLSQTTGFQGNTFLNSKNGKSEVGTFSTKGEGGNNCVGVSYSFHLNIGWNSTYNPGPKDYSGDFDELSVSVPINSFGTSASVNAWKDSNWKGFTFGLGEGIGKGLGRATFNYHKVNYELKENHSPESASGRNVPVFPDSGGAIPPQLQPK